MHGTSLWFAQLARRLCDAARSLGLVTPAFRSPPRIEGDRSIKRRPSGGATVSVRYRDRPSAAVLADMIEGVVAANDLSGSAAEGARGNLWAAVADEFQEVA